MRTPSSFSWRVRAEAEAELRRRGVALGRAVSASEFADRYWSDPASFVRDCFDFPDGEEAAPYQLESLDRMHQVRRAAVRGCHGLGKTTIAAWAIIHFALTREARGVDWKVACTASVSRQLSKYLWPEVRLWCGRLNSRVPRSVRPTRYQLQVLNLRMRFGEAFTASPKDADLIEGAHASELLYVFDEAKRIPEATWDAAEGAFASGNAYALAISTPGSASGRFFAIHARKRGYEEWAVRHVKIEEALAAGRVSQSWVDLRKEQWGEGSQVYRARVLGEFTEAEESVLLPLNYVEGAVDRWRDLAEAGAWPDGAQIGVDVGWFGSDESVAAVRCGLAVRELVSWAKKDTMETAGIVASLLRRYPRAFAVIDVVGIGAGVYDRLVELRLPVVPFNAGAAGGYELDPDADEYGAKRFPNLRSRAWWTLRSLLEPGDGLPIALPDDDKLVEELTTIRWGTNSRGETVVESKDTIRPRLGRSTDRGDAVMMAFYQPPTAAQTYLSDFATVEISPV